MKSFFLVFAIFVVVQGLTEEQKEKLKNHTKLCIAETGVDQAVVQKVRDGDFSSEDPKLKKYALCMLKKIELVDKDGKFHKEVAVAKVSDEEKPKVSEAIDKCLKPGVVVDDEVAWAYTKCYHKEKPNHAVF